MLNMCLLPRKLTWNPKMEVWKMIFLFNWVIFRFHVNFQGCNLKVFRNIYIQNIHLKLNYKHPSRLHFSKPSFRGTAVEFPACTRTLWSAVETRYNKYKGEQYFPRHPKYLLRRCFEVCVWGPNTFSAGIWKPIGLLKTHLDDTTKIFPELDFLATILNTHIHKQ